jgi:hypothetical protein
VQLLITALLIVIFVIRILSALLDTSKGFFLEELSTSILIFLRVMRRDLCDLMISEPLLDEESSIKQP